MVLNGESSKDQFLSELTTEKQPGPDGVKFVKILKMSAVRKCIIQTWTYGGNNWLVRMYRGFYEARTTLISMWRGNPVLTALVFGLPLGFLSLICYSICCADILDADEEEISEGHEKKD